MYIKNLLSSWLWQRALKRHRSRMGRRYAPPYTEYARRAQAAYKGKLTSDPFIANHSDAFRRQGYTWFRTDETEALARSMLRQIEEERRTLGDARVWAENSRYSLGDIYQRFPQVEQLFRGETGCFLKATFGSEFKIFYGILYRSVYNAAGPTGLQRWHSDSGPGTCINLMFCLTDVGARNGAMETLPWTDSLRVFRAEARAQPLGTMDKTSLQDFFSQEINSRFADRVSQPDSGPGLVYPFLNNTIHRGGYPEPGEERIVCVFHIYPSVEAAPLDQYRTRGITKTGPYPKDPAWQ